MSQRSNMPGTNKFWSPGTKWYLTKYPVSTVLSDCHIIQFNNNQKDWGLLQKTKRTHRLVHLHDFSWCNFPLNRTNLRNCTQVLKRTFFCNKPLYRHVARGRNHLQGIGGGMGVQVREPRGNNRGRVHT